ncbi:hypothetical protein SERLADRAFT_386907, partial [Serpula lacrymans var. lacrymans S7.9]
MGNFSTTRHKSLIALAFPAGLSLGSNTKLWLAFVEEICIRHHKGGNWNSYCKFTLENTRCCMYKLCILLTGGSSKL